MKCVECGSNDGPYPPKPPSDEAVDVDGADELLAPNPPNDVVVGADLPRKLFASKTSDDSYRARRP